MIVAGGLISWFVWFFAFTRARHDRSIDMWPMELQLTQ